MARIGYKLMTEEHPGRALVDNAVKAEAAGFDFVSISDHFHPWLDEQGHSPFAWSVLGAIAHATSKIELSTGLTCPILRYHPAIIAQAAATIAELSQGRFTLALGAGERLNEHVTGVRWPSVPERHAMLGEAIEIIQELWQGEVVNHAGEFFDVDHAQLYEAPEKEIPIVVGVSGEHSVHLAIEAGVGIMATEAKPDLVAMYRSQGGKGPVYGEVALAYAPSEEEGRKLAHERFRFNAFDWSVNSELPSPKSFEAATQTVKPEDLADKIPAGPDPQKHLEAAGKFVESGFDHVVLLGIGPDQAGFIDFAQKELIPQLR